MNRHLGYFNSQKEAIEARDLAKREFNFHENHGKVGINV